MDTQVSEILISRITLDQSIQPRYEIDQDTVEQYAHHLHDGAVFPPVVVFQDGDSLLLASGFHRVYAHLSASRTSILADIRQGSRKDAMRYAFGDNEKNGKPPSSKDRSHAYRRAVIEGLCAADDVRAVQSLLKCSTRWARELTLQAREDAKQARDAEIIALSEKGLSQREIAKEVGVDHKTVCNILGEKGNTSVFPHPDPTQDIFAAIDEPTAVAPVESVDAAIVVEPGVSHVVPVAVAPVEPTAVALDDPVIPAEPVRIIEAPLLVKSPSPEELEKETLQRAKEIRDSRREEKKDAMAQQGWSESELKRKELVEQGITVVANQSNQNNLPIDSALIAWADKHGRLVKIDRTGKWGNPFELPADGTRAEVCENYAQYYLPHKPSLLKAIHTLKGKVLACWCYPQQCHGDHLAELANNDN